MTVKTPPIRAITAGPKFHWFGYYDKLQFDPSGRFVLGMRAGFEHRVPALEDTVEIGMIDLEEGQRWIPLDVSRAWCWQQGCMLQWRPGSSNEIVWNDRIRCADNGERFVCHVMNVETREKRTLPQPIYALSPDGRTAIGTDFRRIDHMRPGYGYKGIPDPNVDLLAPSDSGIYRLDLETGAYAFLISIAQIAALPSPHADWQGRKHYFNHLLFNTDGTRFEFLHRSCAVGESSRQTRMLTAALDGSEIRVLEDRGLVSHFIWRDPTHILAWARRPEQGGAFYLYEDATGDAVEAVGPDVMTQDGHCTYLADRDWILNDFTPGARHEPPYPFAYLYHVPSGRWAVLGEFPSPAAYVGELRIDLHPRGSPDGRTVIVDSAHAGDGRQMYLIDVSEIVGQPGAT
jgi:hypothetical protein